MDARLAVISAGVCLYISAIGCQIPPGASSVQPTVEQPQSGVTDEASTDDVKTAGDISPEQDSVQQWIARIDRVDDLHSRVGPQLSEGDIKPSNPNSYEQIPSGSSAGRQADDPADDADGIKLDESDGENEQKEPETPAPAPVLGPVAARAATPSVSLSPQERDTQVSANSPETASNMPVSLDEFAEQWLAQPSETTFRGQLDQRLLLVLAGKYENARAPLEMVTDEQQEMASQFVESLIVIREGHGGDPESEANRVLARVEALMDSLVPLSELRIPTLELTRSVRGFGQYEVFNPPAFLTGRVCEFVVYCEIQNFLSRPSQSGGYESQFSMKTTILNRAGDVVLELSDEHIADKCQTRRRDCFIPRLVHLPATLSPGEYVVKITIIDKIGAKVAEKRTTFRIVARSS